MKTEAATIYGGGSSLLLVCGETDAAMDQLVGIVRQDDCVSTFLDDVVLLIVHDFFRQVAGVDEFRIGPVGKDAIVLVLELRYMRPRSP